MIPNTHIFNAPADTGRTDSMHLGNAMAGKCGQAKWALIRDNKRRDVMFQGMCSSGMTK
jgi:hypothetical protein